jgi:hypothetical protein
MEAILGWWYETLEGFNKNNFSLLITTFQRTVTTRPQILEPPSQNLNYKNSLNVYKTSSPLHPPATNNLHTHVLSKTLNSANSKCQSINNVQHAVTKWHSTRAAVVLTVIACFQAVHISTSQFGLHVLQRTLIEFRLGWIKLNHDMISDLDLDLHQNGR